MNMDELQDWLEFFGKLILDGILITVWIVIAWWLHVYLTRAFPLEGISKLALSLLELLLYLSALYRLLKLLFGPRQKRGAHRWWQ
jgi:hypothetical protein